VTQYGIREYVELFHLAFLDLLGRRLDKRSCVLKGGCNLRFFMKSVRYSEDMDVDVADVSKERLADAVDAILGSAALADVLSVPGLSIQRRSAPKQTQTTQRWKIGLVAPGVSAGLHTKIEFSRRAGSGSTAFEPVDPRLVARYGLGPVMASHYDGASAFAQKVNALASRSRPQARDVFDLHLLLASGAAGSAGEGLDAASAADAAENALSISFEVFKSQVLSFLDPDHRSRYDEEDVWNEMVLRVVERLEAPGAGGREGGRT
jgi:hypothetical protein